MDLYPREPCAHVSSRIHQNATRRVSSELSKARRSESLRDSSKVRRSAAARSGPASRPAGVAEEEGTIRGQIKTRRVTVEWVRNERVCDFGHAVRLYVDLRSTGGGTERSGEKEEKKRRRHGRARERKREAKGVRRDREDSIYSAFVSLPLLPYPVERALRLASIRTRSLPPSERQAEERRRNADTFEGKDEETA